MIQVSSRIYNWDNFFEMSKTINPLGGFVTVLSELQRDDILAGRKRAIGALRHVGRISPYYIVQTICYNNDVCLEISRKNLLKYIGGNGGRRYAAG